LVAAFASFAVSHAADTAPAAKFFVILYAPGPQWKPGVPMKEQGLGAHHAYMQALHDGHKLFAAGPLLESNGGLLIVKADNLDGARDIVARDPAIVAGIFTAQVQSWSTAFDAGQSPAQFLATQP
jgi:uncharacterized protein YciI